MTEGWPQDDGKDFPLRHVLLILMQMGGPIWGLHADDAGRKWRPSSPGDLPISDALIDAINDWFEDYLDHITDEHINPQTNPDFPFDTFNERGAELAVRLRSELGPEWTLVFEPAELIPPDGQV